MTKSEQMCRDAGMQMRKVLVNMLSCPVDERYGYEQDALKILRPILSEEAEEMRNAATI